MPENLEVKALALQYYWKTGTWVALQPVPFKVLLVGQYDGCTQLFKNAQLHFAGQTAPTSGDVMLRICEEDGYSQNGAQNPLYAQIILFVYLTAMQTPKQPNFCCVQLDCAKFSTFVAEKMQAKGLAGACGLQINPQTEARFKMLVFEAAKQRFLKKASQLELVGKDSQTDEEVLFQQILRVLGYPKNQKSFLALAERFTYAKFLENQAEFSMQVSLQNTLAQWFGSLGLLEKAVPEFLNLQLLKDNWAASEETALIETLTTKGLRPVNQPTRRLLGAYQHLEATYKKGLFKSWLDFVYSFQQTNVSQKQILENLQGLFLSPYSLVKTPKDSHLIGQERMLLVVINAILPYFFAWAEKYNQPAVQKLLFNAFLLLPHEGMNHKTKLMEARLDLKTQPLHLQRKLFYSQGLLEIYQSCCHTFEQGCTDCQFLRLLEPAKNVES